ncbi:uncharacterized protein PG986_000141 [Apiospora aurea]|uniref:Heterokaryon incompatibility domain-containing protein n=1 Tax=Apiospora aurea TaxID=335848 RepID=A0ABR1QTD7_9PEZI
MEHLRSAYEDISLKTAPYHQGLDGCLHQDSNLLSHGHSYQDFIHFPSHHGYIINENHTIQEAAQTGCQALHRPTRYQFLQAWLYFALLRCVVRGDAPLLDNEEYISNDRLRLDTGELPNTLKQWEGYMRDLSVRDLDRAVTRCLEANQILVLARRIVTTELASNKGPRNGDSEELQDLCFMILGETLSSTLIHIMKVCGIALPGWQIEDGGWGPPGWVFTQMKKSLWCKRFQDVLKNQLGQNATLLYVTLIKLGTEPAHHNHDCTPDECKYVEARHGVPNNPNVEYVPQHYHKCEHRGTTPSEKNNECWMVGPDEADLVRLVNECHLEQTEQTHAFPLLRVERDGEHHLRVDVVKWTSTNRLPYATISHVWAHGLGNKAGQQIWHCQLRYILTLLEEVSAALNAPEMAQEPTKSSRKGKERMEAADKRECRYFWLDTLAIPVNDKTARQKAVERIYSVFDNASHSIVVDKYLLNESWWGNSRTIGLRLLSSGWMQRLWTLQEAFVSEELSVALNEEKIRGIDGLWKPNKNANILVDSLTEMVARKLTQNLMGEERAIRNEYRKQPNGRPSTARAPLLIASAWHSARYRTVGRLENETQVLASLLNVQPPVLQEIAHTEIPKEDKRWPMFRETLMARFWERVVATRNLERAIPGGIIFLPGKRLNIKGFGWAPATSMSGRDEDYPYPLSTLRPRTELLPELLPEGIKVSYPGYLIRSSRGKCLEIINGSFHFSVNMGLYDWYQATPVTGGKETSNAESAVQEINNGDKPRLAVVVSRPRPVETPPEIGLLVSIYKDTSKSKQTVYETEESILYCRIIRRLKVSRISDPRTLGAGSGTASNRTLRLYEMFDPGIVGVATSEQQQWCVDGYVTSDARPNPDTAAPPPGLRTGSVASGSQAQASIGSRSGAAQDEPRVQPFRSATDFLPPHHELTQAPRADTLPASANMGPPRVTAPDNYTSRTRLRRFRGIVPTIAELSQRVKRGGKK